MALTGMLTFLCVVETFYAISLWGFDLSTMDYVDPYTKFFNKARPTPEDIWLNQWFAFGVTWKVVNQIAITYFMDMSDSQLRRFSNHMALAFSLGLGIMISHGNTNLPFGLFVPLEHYQAVFLHTLLLFWLGPQIRSGDGDQAPAKRSIFKPTDITAFCGLIVLLAAMFWFFDITVVNHVAKYMKGGAKKVTTEGMAMSQWFSFSLFAQLIQFTFVFVYGNRVQLGRFLFVMTCSYVSAELFIRTLTGSLFTPDALEEGTIMRGVLIVVTLIGGLCATPEKVVKED